MPNSLPRPASALKLIGNGLQQIGERSHVLRTQSPQASLPILTSNTETPVGIGGVDADDDLRHLAWNGSISEGALLKYHRKRVAETIAARTAHAVRQSALSNEIAAVEAELAALVEEPPKSAPQPKVLQIVPNRKGN